MTYRLHFAAVLCSTLLASPALAAPQPPHKFGDPIMVGQGLTLDPIVEGRLRWEHVDQPTTDADAVTLRLRLGGELKHAKSHLALLAEAGGTVTIANNYNAFGFVVPSGQRRPQFSTVADPENIELNRLQLQYKSKVVTITVGRQRINLDDQRFVGAVGWRQNEQTFDAARIEAKLGPVSLDGTYSISQRTVFGYDAGQRTAYDGNFVFLGAGEKLGPVNIKASPICSTTMRPSRSAPRLSRWQVPRHMVCARRPVCRSLRWSNSISRGALRGNRTISRTR